MTRTKLILFLTLCLLTAVFISSATAAPAQRPSQAAVDWRFGVIESYEAPAAANALGAGWTRVRFQWAQTQAGGPGSWTPPVSDAQISGEIANGRTVVGLLIGVPDWAWDNGLPRGLDLPYDDPNNTWAAFVREAVSRYNGRINHWIIWNEPDIRDRGNPGFTWPGTVEQFFQLQRVSYLAAKEVNPNAVIHLAAFAYFDTPSYIFDFMDVLVSDPAAAGNNYYFDVMTAHLYFQPDVIYTIIQTFYGATAGRGIPWKPVWLVETNAPPIDDPAWPVPNWTFRVTQDEQAAFIPQGLASALAAGAQRIAIYKMQDVPGDETANPEPFGLLRMDGSRRPAYTTYQVAIQYLAGMQGVRRVRWDAVGQIRLDQGSHTTTVLFSRLPAPQRAEVEATANTAVLVDQWGARRSISAQNGVFTVELPGALCTQTAGDYCMIGGTTYYLVQGVDGGSAPGAPPPPAPPQDGDPVNSGTVSSGTVSSETVTNTPITNTPITNTPTSTRTSRPTRTPTAVPTDTPTATITNTPTPVPATEVAAAAPTAVPTLPPPAETAAAPGGVSFWLIGAAALLAVGLGGWWWRSR